MGSPLNIHGTGLVMDGVGVLLRGASGAGKSLLALELLDDAEVRGQKASLVADDRLNVSVRDGKLMMAAPAAITGMIELRGRGIIDTPYVASARLHLVVDLVDDLQRFVEPEVLTAELCGVVLARCPIPNRATIDSAHQKLLLRAAIKALEGTLS